MESTSATRLLTADEAARELRLTRQSIYRMIGDGRLPAVRIGQDGPLRIEPEAVEALLRPARAAEEQTR
jgi:excisionase family DNA binding protein